jgi:hypothetical protein
MERYGMAWPGSAWFVESERRWLMKNKNYPPHLVAAAKIIAAIIRRAEAEEKARKAAKAG